MKKPYPGAVPATLMAAVLFTPLKAFSEETLQQVDQHHLNDLVTHGQGNDAFLQAFEAGDELSEFDFAANHGVGANIGEGPLYAVSACRSGRGQRMGNPFSET